MRMLFTPLPRAAAVVVACSIGLTATAAPPLHVGSKRFTESYILGEIVKQSATGAGETAATHSQGLGNTAIVLNALTTGSIALPAAALALLIEAGFRIGERWLIPAGLRLLPQR